LEGDRAMRIEKAITAAAAFVATTGAAMAQAVERASPAAHGQSELFGGSTLLTIVLIVALGIGVYLLVDDEDDPDSP
jgi:hypothetical protein